jgi:DNA polymerase-1
MKKLVLDIETNAIHDWENLTDLKTIHCICLMDVATGTMHSYNSQTPGSLETAMSVIGDADVVIGHNSIRFDWPALLKMDKEGFLSNNPPFVADTQVMAKCVYPDLKNHDFKEQSVATRYAGSHSLKCWGMRLGIHKDSHGESEDWTTWSQEMQDYCEQDVRVTARLYEHLIKLAPSKEAIMLEHQFAQEIHQQVRNGFPFDEAKAALLAAKLMTRRVDLSSELQALFEPTVVETKSPIGWSIEVEGKTYEALTKTALKTVLKDAGLKQSLATNAKRKGNKTKTTPFNPGSRDQIAARLMKQGWKPAAYEGKRPAINEAVLKDIGTPAALKLLEYLLVQKRLGALAEGKNSWMTMVRSGRIHGNVDTLGAYSGRCSHSKPNLGQIPASRAPYGSECRELFKAPDNKVLVGADASGIELRVLAHYLSKWDKGDYAKTIVEGDIHTANQEAAGLTTRDEAKKFIYMWLYGAGDKAIGEIVDGGEREGRNLKEQFLRKIPAVGSLMKAIDQVVKRSSTIVALDGRVLPARKAFSALNLLCQSAAAIIMKKSLVLFAKSANPDDYEMHGNVHDEVQFSCDADKADELGKLFVDSITKAGEALGVRCPLDGEYKVGKNWKETH